MIPRMNPSLSPPFHELDAYTFQNLCRELHGRQPGITTCDVYGTQGQSQRGIDLLAHRRASMEKEVGQCKCYNDFPPAEIRKASEEFLEHLGYWQQQQVKRFILFVACDLDRTQQQDEICKQKQCFEKYGVEYEAWSASTLRLNLAPHRDIVERHLPTPYWVENICGSEIRSSSVPTGQPTEAPSILRTMAFVGSQVELLASGLSKGIAEKLEEIRERYREGRTREAYTHLQKLREEGYWGILEQSLRGRILRTLAAYVLNIERDESKARALTDEARRIDPTGDDTILRTLLKYHLEGAESALLEIGVANSLDVVNLKIALLLDLSRADCILAVIEAFPEGLNPNAETRRLHALAFLLKGSLPSAQMQIQAALNERGKWESVRTASAIINYFSALSPVALPNTMVPWPEPIDWAFIKRDNQSLERLRKAKAEFEGLALQPDREDESRHLLEVWCLASLANDPDQQVEAQEFCRSILGKDPTNSRALTWALARDYEVDLSSIERAMEEFLGVDKDGL
jgi:hypothetical protein